MKSKQTNSFFILSFIPAAAYWYLEARYPIKIAVIGGIILAILEIAFERLFFGEVHKLSKLNFWVLVVLGGLSYLGEEGIWFKLQPFFTGLILGGALIWGLLKGQGFMTEMMHSMGQIPVQLFRPVEWHMAILVMVYGLWMGGIALWASTSVWLFFKTAGFYIVFILFMLVETLVLRNKLKKMIKL